MATNWTAAQLAALDDALAKGVKSVSYGDRRVEYATTDEMLRLRAIMAASIAGTDRGDRQLIFAGRIS